MANLVWLILDDRSCVSDLWWQGFCLWSLLTDLLSLIFDGCFWSLVADLLFLFFDDRCFVTDLWWPIFCFWYLLTDLFVPDLWWPIFCLWSLMTGLAFRIFDDRSFFTDLWWPSLGIWTLMTDVMYLIFDGRSCVSDLAQAFLCTALTAGRSFTQTRFWRYLSHCLIGDTVVICMGDTQNFSKASCLKSIYPS